MCTMPKGAQKGRSGLEFTMPFVSALARSSSIWMEANTDAKNAYDLGIRQYPSRSKPRRKCRTCLETVSYKQKWPQFIPFRCPQHFRLNGTDAYQFTELEKRHAISSYGPSKVQKACVDSNKLNYDSWWHLPVACYVLDCSAVRRA